MLTFIVRLWDKTKQHETSLSDSEDEGTGGRRHIQSHREANGTKKRRSSRSPRSTSRSNGNSATPVPASTADGITAPGRSIDSGLLDAPPTAQALRTTTEKAADGNHNMSDDENGVTKTSFETSEATVRPRNGPA